jgi:hypothetical protein
MPVSHDFGWSIFFGCCYVFLSFVFFLFPKFNQGRPHYRWYTIQNIPSLKILDLERITRTERNRAQQHLESNSILIEEEGEKPLYNSNNINNNNNYTFTPGEGASAEESFVVNFTKEEKEQIRQMVANAKSSQEIEQIERSVKRGIFPGDKKAAISTTNGNININNNINNNNNNQNRKRPVPEDDVASTTTTTTTTIITEIVKKQKTES